MSHLGRSLPKFLVSNSRKWNENPWVKPKPPTCCHYCKEPGHWKMNCYKLKHFRCLQPLTRLSNILILNVAALRNYKGSSQSSSFTGSQKHSSSLGVNLLQSEQTAEPCSQRSTPLPWNSPCRRVLKQVRRQGCLWTSRSPASKKSVPSYLGPLREIHIIFSLVHPPLSIYQAKTSKRRIMPEFLSPKRRK